MNKSNECNIVKDLLPSYIDGLTSKESNIFIKNHLSNCTECKKELDYMKKDNESKNAEKEYINYAKKTQSKFKALKTIAVVFMISTIIFLALFLRMVWFNYLNLSKNAIENGKELYDAYQRIYELEEELGIKHE